MYTNKVVIYIAGRYSDGDTLSEEEKEKNLEIMDGWCIKFLNHGFAFINPIRNDLFLEGRSDWDLENIMQMDFALISKVDYVFFCPEGFKEAPEYSGVKREHRFCIENNIKVMYHLPKERGDTKPGSRTSYRRNRG